MKKCTLQIRTIRIMIWGNLIGLGLIPNTTYGGVIELKPCPHCANIYCVYIFYAERSNGTILLAMPKYHVGHIGGIAYILSPSLRC